MVSSSREAAAAKLLLKRLLACYYIKLRPLVLILDSTYLVAGEAALDEATSLLLTTYLLTH